MAIIAPIHLIGILISIALFYQSVRLVRKGKESVFEFLLWSGFGLALLILSLGSSVTVLGVLDALSFVLSLLGFTSGRDGVFVLAILGLLLMLFYTYVNSKTNRKHLYDLNQEVALLRQEIRELEQDDRADSESE